MTLFIHMFPIIVTEHVLIQYVFDTVTSFCTVLMPFGALLQRWFTLPLPLLGEYHPDDQNRFCTVKTHISVILTPHPVDFVQ